MSTVKCPFCAHDNFMVAAYCAKCQRPLPRDGAQNVDDGRHDATQVALRPFPAGPRWGAAPGARTAEIALPDPGTTAIPDAMRRQAQARKVASPPAATLPAAPPVPRRQAQAAEHSAETVVRAVDLAALRRQAGLLPAVPAAPAAPSVPPVEFVSETTEVRATVASLPRLCLANAIDLGASLALAVAMVGAEMALFGRALPDERAGWLDVLAEWIHQNPGAAQRGACILAGLSLLHAALGGITGRTLGRHCTGLLLVNRFGQRLRWPWALLRGVVSVASVLPAGAGFFYMVVDGRRRAWHDLLLGTQVVVPAGMVSR